MQDNQPMQENQNQPITLEQLQERVKSYKSARTKSATTSAYNSNHFTLSNGIYSIERKPKHVFKLYITDIDSDRTAELKSDGASDITQELASKMLELLSANYTPIAKDVASELELERVKLELLSQQISASKSKQEQAQLLEQASAKIEQISELEPLAQTYKQEQAQELANKLKPKKS